MPLELQLALRNSGCCSSEPFEKVKTDSTNFLFQRGSPVILKKNGKKYKIVDVFQLKGENVADQETILFKLEYVEGQKEGEAQKGGEGRKQQQQEEKKITTVAENEIEPVRVEIISQKDFEKSEVKKEDFKGEKEQMMKNKVKKATKFSLGDLVCKKEEEKSDVGGDVVKIYFFEQFPDKVYYALKHKTFDAKHNVFEVDASFKDVPESSLQLEKEQESEPVKSF